MSEVAPDPPVAADEIGPLGQPMTFWREVRAGYFDPTQTILALCTKFDLTEGEFNYARKELGWKRRKVAPVSRKTLITRLFRLIQDHITRLEAEMTAAAKTPTGEREVALLDRLVGTLGKLIDIEAREIRASKPKQTKDMSDIRNKLVQRIEELKRA